MAYYAPPCINDFQHSGYACLGSRFWPVRPLLGPFPENGADSQKITQGGSVPWAIMVVNPERSGPWSIVCSGTVDPAALAGSVCCAWTVLAGPDRAKYPVLETKTREPMCSSIHSDSDPRAVWPVGTCVSSYGRTSGHRGRPVQPCDGSWWARSTKTNANC